MNLPKVVRNLFPEKDKVFPLGESGIPTKIEVDSRSEQNDFQDLINSYEELLTTDTLENLVASEKLIKIAPGEFGDYYILNVAGQIGEGGIGQVFLALVNPEETPHLYFAAKVVKDHGEPRKSNYDAALVREAKLLMNEIDHPLILKPIELISQHNNFVVEKAKGGSWKQTPVTQDYHVVIMPLQSGTAKDLNKYKDYKQEDWVGVMFQVAEALDYLNDKGITHNDVKASNILLTQKPQLGNTPGYVTAQLADFGLYLSEGSLEQEYISGESRSNTSNTIDQYNLAKIAMAQLFDTRYSGGKALLKQEMEAMPRSYEVISKAMKDLESEPGSRYDSCLDFMQHLTVAMLQDGVISRYELEDLIEKNPYFRNGTSANGNVQTEAGKALKSAIQ